MGKRWPAWHHCPVDQHSTDVAFRSRPRAGAARRGVARWLQAWVVLAVCSLGSWAGADEPARVPIVFHVVERDGEAVAPPSFIAAQLAAANEIYAPLGIELVDQRHVPLAAAHAELITRGDRDALAPHVRKGVIDCFIVAKLMDVDEPGRERRGVHWHPPKPQLSFLIVSKISKPYVLAHELGHFFGNPKHSDVAGNLMSYSWTVQPPVLDAGQIERVKKTLATMLKSGRLAPPASEDPAR